MSIRDADLQDGFTLLETIVAFVILSMVLGAATLSVSYSARLYHRADQIRAANQLAEQLIAERFERGPNQPRQEAGREGDLAWAIRRQEAARSAMNGTRLMAFDLRISDRSGRILAQHQSYYIEAAP